MLFSLPDGGPGALNLNFLTGSAIDMDPADDHTDGPDRGGRRGDGMNLITPSSETWGLGSLHSDHQSNQGSFEESMGGQWSAGPAGLSASSVLGHSSAISNGLMSATPGFTLTRGDDEATRRSKTTHLSDMSKTANQSASRANADPAAPRGMDWVGDTGLGTGMSPMNLSGLVQGDLDDDGSGERNHDLDFFNFA